MSDLRSHLSALLARCEAAQRAVDDAFAHSLARIDAAAAHGDDTGEAFQDASQAAVRVPKVRVLVGNARLAIATAHQVLDGAADEAALSTRGSVRAREAADEALAALDTADREVRQARLWAGLPVEPRRGSGCPSCDSADCGGGELEFHPEG